VVVLWKESQMSRYSQLDTQRVVLWRLFVAMFASSVVTQRSGGGSSGSKRRRIEA
jgi:hypothetical protein